jgi:hypothetical protein
VLVNAYITGKKYMDEDAATAKRGTSNKAPLTKVLLC